MRSFPILVDALIRTRFDNNAELAATASGLAATTLWRWRHRPLGTYRIENVRQFGKAAQVDPAELWAVIQADQQRRVAGQRIPLPDLSDLTSGPKKGVDPRLQQQRIAAGQKGGPARARALSPARRRAIARLAAAARKKR